jgi:GH15 family glucan-1,4-alpha-glucosidase
MCLPELDSPSVFAALLDSGSGGHLALRPRIPFTLSRRYLERINVLETTFHTDRGAVVVIDALTLDDGQTAPWRELVRDVHATAGSVPMQWELRPRFGYGQRAARFHRSGPAIVAWDGALALGLRT